jgi:hypothetical protein
MAVREQSARRDASRLPLAHVGWAIGLWLLVSLASLFAMYHLWWTRERVLYAGKSATEQRGIVLGRAGVPAQTLDLARQADADWPEAAAYTADGSEVSLSYFKYLVLPRVPSGSDTYQIREVDGGHELTPADGVAEVRRDFSTVGPTPRGLVLSMCALFSIALGLSRLGLGVPEGMACASLLLCLATVTLKPAFGSYVPVGVCTCVLGILGAWLVWARRRLGFGRPAVSEGFSGRRSRLARWTAMAVVGGAVAWALLMAVVVVPDDWDAWAQWAPKAKILLLSSGPLGDIQYFVPGSGDYPLLWPSVWAFSGWCAGGWEEQWGKGWGAVFLFLTAWQIQRFSVSAGWRRRDGWMAAAWFASMPVVPLVASWGYAEAPLWLMLACGTSRLLQWRDSGARRDLWLAGLFIAGAACTKNEGILFAALCIAWVALCGRRLRDVAAVALPALVVVGVWKAYVTLEIGASSHALKSVGASSLEFLRSPDRLLVAGNFIVRHWLDPKQWNVVLPVSLLASIWMAWRGGRRNRVNLLLPAGMLAGLLLVVLMHGDNWLWQMGVAWNRLTLQFFVVLLPVMVAGYRRP